MNKLSLLFYYIYSLIFCLRYLPLRLAVHIPILIHPSVNVESLPRGAIQFHGKLRHGMFVIGFKWTVGRSNCKSLIAIKPGARLIVSELVQMARGTRIVISKGEMQIGRNFCCNGDCYFYCTTKITIGNNNMYGWNISFNTSDGHHIYENGQQKPMEGDITIGHHVWIASHCIIGKNTFVADDCVVAQHSLVGKRFEKPKCLIGGMPAKVIKDNFTWSA